MEWFLGVFLDYKKIKFYKLFLDDDKNDDDRIFVNNSIFPLLTPIFRCCWNNFVGDDIVSTTSMMVHHPWHRDMQCVHPRTWDFLPQHWGKSKNNKNSCIKRINKYMQLFLYAERLYADGALCTQCTSPSSKECLFLWFFEYKNKCFLWVYNWVIRFYRFYNVFIGFINASLKKL